MKAVLFERYGSPDGLELREVPRPVPRPRELLIRVHATTVNRTDTAFLRSDPWINRLFTGLLRPRFSTLGSEFAGRVEAVGEEVRLFDPGDAVFGLSHKKLGAHAEYLCLPETALLDIKPRNLHFSEAAAVCDGMMLAMTYMRLIDFKRGPRMLINGAGGSIGSAALQLAHYFGAEVTAVIDTPQLGLARALGAEHVIDYRTEDFTRGPEAAYDLVFDAVGKSTYARCRRLLKPGGIYMSTELGPGWQNVWLGLATRIGGRLPDGRQVYFPLPAPGREDIAFFRELLEVGHYRPVIDRTYPLAEIARAFRYVASGRKTGNVVVEVAPGSSPGHGSYSTIRKLQSPADAIIPDK